EKEQFVMDDRSAQTAPEMVYGRTRLDTRGSVGEVIGCVEDCAVPQFVQIAVKLVGAGFGDVIDLGRSIPALVHGIRKRIYRHLRVRIEAEHEIGREAAIEVR